MAGKDWIDSHSVNCFLCHRLFDEREGMKLSPEGEICPKCQKLPFISECVDCGRLYNTSKVPFDVLGICTECLDK